MIGRMTSLPVLAAATMLVACDGAGGTQPGTTRFGQVGEVRIQLETPLFLGAGELEQRLTWNSSGPWQLTEVISYRGLEGDATVRRSPVNSDVLAGSYAQWVTQINEAQGLSLFISGLDQSLDPECPQGQSRLTLELRDETVDASARWIRCAEGDLSEISTQDSGPDPAAARVVLAAQLVRDYTQGEGNFVSTYAGSHPFGTLDRGEDSGADLDGPLAITDSLEWAEFWARHIGSSEPEPQVDFDEEAVIVGAVGIRREAGDSVEIRRILPLGQFTAVETVERIPGDFCAPAEVEHVPFHIVVTPSIPTPVQFNQLQVERVPCV